MLIRRRVPPLLLQQRAFLYQLPSHQNPIIQSLPLLRLNHRLPTCRTSKTASSKSNRTEPKNLPTFVASPKPSPSKKNQDACASTSCKSRTKKVTPFPTSLSSTRFFKTKLPTNFTRSSPTPLPLASFSKREDWCTRMPMWRRVCACRRTRWMTLIASFRQNTK